MQMLARLPLLAGIVLGLALSSIGTAWAHPQLLSTYPAENAVGVHSASADERLQGFLAKPGALNPAMVPIRTEKSALYPR